MANPVAPPEFDRQTTNPILIVAGTVLVVAIVTVLLYSIGDYEEGADVLAAGGQTANTSSAVSTGACGSGPSDDSYSVAVASDPDPPRPERTTFRLTIRQAGRAVTGAKVCIAADMPTMEHPGLNTVAKELSGGRYEAVVKFGMGGSWMSTVTIAEPGRPVVSVPVEMEVAQIEQE